MNADLYMYRLNIFLFFVNLLLLVLTGTGMFGLLMAVNVFCVYVLGDKLDIEQEENERE